MKLDTELQQMAASHDAGTQLSSNDKLITQDHGELGILVALYAAS